MGYNLKTTILECSEVQLYDYEVKVAMEEIEETSYHPGWYRISNQNHLMPKQHSKKNSNASDSMVIKSSTQQL